MRCHRQNNLYRSTVKLKYYLLAACVALWTLADHSLAFHFLPRIFPTRKQIQRPQWRSKGAVAAKISQTSQMDDEQKRIGKIGRIPAETIEEIKTYADIVTVIESYNLPFFSRSTDGHKAKCVCPFHNDRNPSLHIDNSKGIYKCFSCGAGGDVFNFVREYDFISSEKNRQKKPKMSYPASILKVATEFCGEDILKQLPVSSGDGNGNNKPMSPEKKRKLEKQRKKKERIFLANAAAADFYAKMLITSPSAGIARAHLLQRGITPTMIRTFGVGFAPDAYFNNETGAGKAGRKDGDSWGKGSLVEHLKEWNFTPHEILDAGLATVTSSARSRLQMSGAMPGETPSIFIETDHKNQTKSMSNRRGGENNSVATGATLDHKDLIDRFRSRLMVPIFDESGKHVIAFGGRHLELLGSDVEKNQSYKAAKYINSPESAVFIKTEILFGIHAARAAIEASSETRSTDVPASNFVGTSSTPSIVIVEGYFDAITLFGAGIKETAASMGTALTMAQLKMAANTIGGGGRIILCLDNDQAGITAAERVCTGSSMWDFLDSTGVEISIASLPSEINDPAEFIEKNGGIGSASSGDTFRKKILNEARTWDDWYVSRLISKYNPDERSSFSTVCEEVSDFLSTHPNAAERTKRAYDAAGKLADYISGEEGRSNNTPLRIQLESDLLSMASRKAAAKNAMARRVEAADGGVNVNDIVARMSSGEGSNPSQVKMETSSLSKIPPKTRGGDRKSRPLNTTPKQPYQRGNPESNSGFNRRRRNTNEQRRDPPLTKHFTGFRFSENDAAWLGIKDKKSNKKFVLGEPQKILGEKMKNHVYFNSNKYLGNEKSILSRIASANQSSPTISRSNPLIEPDADRLLLDAEYRLLHTMVHWPAARLAMKSALSNRMDDGNTLLQWSSLEREWLFQCLTDSPGHEALPSELQDGGTVLQLKENLRNRQDAPAGAFVKSDVGSDGVGEKQGTKVTSSFDNGTPYFIDIEVSPGRIDSNSGDVKPSSDEIDNIYEGDGLRFGSEISESLDAPTDSELITDDNELHEPYNSEEPKETMGVLDAFFEESEEFSALENVMKGPVGDEERAELTVQETVAVMLKATAIKRLKHIKNEWKVVNRALKERTKLKSMTDEVETAQKGDIQNKSRDHELAVYDSMSNEELNHLCSGLGKKVVEAMDTARELTNSSQQLNERLLRYCISNDQEGRLSEVQRKTLFKMLDEHLASLPEDTHRPDTPGDDDDYIFGIDEYDVNIDSHFGGRRITLKKESDGSGRTPVKTRQSLLNYESIFE